MKQRWNHYDIIVIGGGHAGAEAAWAAANLLRPRNIESGGREGNVALITMDPSKTGAMSCNPAIGGLAKGQMVREIDALGGLMGLAADATGIQFKMLNRSKGPAVRGPRCQSDKYRYAEEVQRLMATRKNIEVLAGIVEQIVVEHGRVTGVTFVPSLQSSISNLQSLHASSIILTTGTFMRGLMHTGERKTEGGRVGESAATGISAALQSMGFELGRLKTGTPPRLAAETIDFSSLEVQPGDDNPTPFSDMTSRDAFPALEQRHCWMTYTNELTHEAIRANLDRAPMYNGQIETAGPRYCPSIEDKVVRFRDKQAHHVFLEPESLSTNEIYCNGISTSLPADVQDIIVGNMPGCENAKILRYGYAVEYDMVRPHQIDATCMTKSIDGFFLAGQINGTSGYEEAAAQGLVAGLNAVRHIRGESLVRFERDQAYIGVLMDDLVTKTPREPYRMFTSRAEHRLLLRADNAADRLTTLGREWGLVDDDRWRLFNDRRAAFDALRDYFKSQSHDGKRLSDWIRRPDVSQDWVMGRLTDSRLPALAKDDRIVAAYLADVLYEGYVDRHRREHEKLVEREHASLPTGFDYAQVNGLRREAGDVLNRFQPATYGQAGRLAGVNPADLMVVRVALDRRGALDNDAVVPAPAGTVT